MTDEVEVEDVVTEQIETVDDDGRIYLSEMSSILGRDEHTVRTWIRESERIYGMVDHVPINQGYLPRDLWPERESEGHKRIYWTADQLDGLQEYAAMKARRRGWRGASRA